MKTLLASLMLTGFVCKEAVSQDRFAIEFIGGRLFNDPLTSGLPSYRDGFSIGAGFGYEFSQQLQTNVRVVYSELPTARVSVPVLRVTDAAAVFFEGEKASMFEISGGLKMVSETFFVVKPYLHLRGGLYSIETETRVVYSKDILTDMRYPPSPLFTHSANGFGAIGAGFQFSLASGASWNVETAFHKIFGRRTLFIPLLLTGTFGL